MLSITTGAVRGGKIRVIIQTGILADRKGRYRFLLKRGPLEFHSTEPVTASF
jgi:hypothetical protein